MASSSTGTPTLLPVTQLQALEEEAWSDPLKRELYKTVDIPGFPWFTVASPRGSAPAGTPSTGPSEGEAHHEVARRHVIPYEYTFKVFAKERWIGKRLLDVYAEELKHHSRAYYEACLLSGRLRRVTRAEIQNEQRRHQQQQRTERAMGDDGRGKEELPTRAKWTSGVSRRILKRGLGDDAPPALLLAPAAASSPPSPPATEGQQNGNQAGAVRDGIGERESRNAVLQDGDVVLHSIHRHEIPIVIGGGDGGSSSVEPVYLLSVRIASCGLLSVLKPTGLPTHATGRFQYNSLLVMLEYVLAPKRIEKWLWDEDPLMQSLVSSIYLTEEEKGELFAYYGSAHEGAGDAKDETVSLAKALRPCYRLDRVTSGILLLGVSQAATKRVSTALMHKSKAMDGAAALALEDTTQGMEKSSVASLLTADYGLRKRYLARVDGCFPSDSPLLQEALAQGQRSTVSHVPEAVLEAINAGFHTSQLSTAGAEMHSECKEDVHWQSHAPGIVMTTPILNGKREENGGREEDGEQETAILTTHATAKAGGPMQKRKSVLSSAVTVFQALRNGTVQMRDERKGEGLFTVLQCIPFTGRLHQIRIHLSNWGFPIVNDVNYGYSKNQGIETDQALSLPHGSQRPLCGLYFDKSTLPKAQQALFPIPEAYSLHASRTSDGGSGSDSAGTANGDTAGEPLCYECARRLTIASVDENGSAQKICLHAWRYELDLEAIFPDDASREQNGASKEEQQPSPFAWKSTRYCFTEKGRVIFTAPMPYWAKQ